MKKYSRKLLSDYLLGKSIDDYDIDELESNPEFIKEIIDFSNDKSMYNLCDDELKKNFNLMKFLVLKFKDDEQFIKKIARDFSNCSDNETDIFEINIIVSELVKIDYENIAENDSFIDAKDMFHLLNLSYMSEMKGEEDYDVINFLQMGFICFKETYEGRKTIIDYIAKEMVSLILTKEGLSLEELVHSKFKSKEKLEKVGTINFIINYIASYDSNLAEYLQANIKLIEPVKNDLDRIKDNFENYNDIKREEMMYWIIEYVQKKSEDLCGYFSGTQLLEFIANDLKIADDPTIKNEIEDYNNEYGVNSLLSDEDFYETFDDKDDYEFERELKERALIKSFEESGDDEAQEFVDIMDQLEYERMQKDDRYIDLKNKIKAVLKGNKEPENYYEETKIDNKGKILAFVPRNGRKEKK